MNVLDKLSNEVRDISHALAEGWHEVWDNARNAITKFTPSHEDEKRGSNRWGLLSADLQENNDSVLISIEAPGLDNEDFNISLHGRTLVVKGTKQFSSDRDEGHYHITERAYGRFERVFALPTDVNEEGTRAIYKNGVLNIELPKSVKGSPRKISVVSD